jgi:hypothetical protein
VEEVVIQKEKIIVVVALYTDIGKKDAFTGLRMIDIIITYAS